MTFFNELTFFNADISQSEVEDSFQLASDWIKSVQKNVDKSKAVTLLAPCCNRKSTLFRLILVTLKHSQIQVTEDRFLPSLIL